MINLTKVKLNRPFKTHTFSAKTMIWYKLIGFNENYSWATYQLQNYEIRSFYLLTIWMRLEWTQSILSSVSSTPKKRRRDPWSSTIFKNKISLEIRCSEDVEKMTFQGGQCDSRVPVFCKKKTTHFIPEHDDLDHVICDLDDTNDHDD